MTAEVQQYKAAVYLRVSREDQDKEQSNSIINQRLLIEEYLKTKPEITITQEQVDDGYSGTGFDRPGFNKMMESVRAGEINCIVVKDLSRFGRNYIETGRYIQQIFPFLGLRFIAVNDGFDSLYRNNSTDNILIPFKNLINDAYSRDISIKIKSQLDLKRKKGEFIGAFAPYGYQKHAQDKNKLIIDTYAAAVVGQIFRLKLAGYSHANIARQLNDCHIYSPAEYKKAGGEAYISGFRVYSSSAWTAVSVGRILSNPVYVGDMQQGKSYAPSFRGGRRLPVPPDNWISAQGTHEPIVSREKYDLVQQLLSEDARTSPHQEQLYPLSGRIYCADCGQPMVRKVVSAKGSRYSYYICSLHKAAKQQCSSHSISAEWVEKALEQIINTHIKLAGGVPGCAEDPSSTKAVEAAHRSFHTQEVLRYQELLVGVYEDYKEGLLSDQDYTLLSDTYKQKLQALVTKAQGSMDESDGHGGSIDLVAPSKQSVSGDFLLTRLSAVGLIHRIRVQEGGRILAEMSYCCPSRE